MAIKQPAVAVLARGGKESPHNTRIREMRIREMRLRWARTKPLPPKPLPRRFRGLFRGLLSGIQKFLLALRRLILCRRLPRNLGTRGSGRIGV
jgi:hypothetical protein